MELPDNVWEQLLAQCSRTDVGRLRLTATSWRDQIDRCLNTLELQKPSPARLTEAAGVFRCLSSLRIKSLETGLFDLSSLHAFHRLATLKLTAQQERSVLVRGDLLHFYPRLRRLQLEGVSFDDDVVRLACSDAAAPQAANAPHLQELCLVGCDLHTVGQRLLYSLPALPALRKLRVDWGEHIVQPPKLQVLSACLRLQALSLSCHSSAFQDACDGLCHVTTLHSVSLTFTRALAATPLDLALLVRALSHSRYLDSVCVQSHSGVNDRVLEEVSVRLPKLSSLDLRVLPHYESAAYWLPFLPFPAVDAPAVTRAGMSALQSLTSLRALRLRNCGLGHDALCVLSVLTGLTLLDVSGCSHVDDAAMFAVSNLVSLQHLALHGCPALSDIGAAVIARSFPALTHLDLGGCSARMGDLGVAALCSLRALRMLSLAHSEAVGDAGLVALAAAPVLLESLSLRACTRVTDKGLSAVCRSLTLLTSLQLDHCTQLSPGALAGVAQLPVLASVSLADTRVTPSVITDLQRHVDTLAHSGDSGWWMLADIHGRGSAAGSPSC